ncbi:hypothetical protein BLX87_09255 [Bacillus sp. VT-16-64]|nr:hypothetical protein BLX87_09255 [Bacillus sp. VT-16-64]
MLAKITACKIVPILRGMEIEDALFLAGCLQEAELNILEVSLNRPNSYIVLEKLAKEFGKDMEIGAGTVLTKKMACDARDCGATFFLAPNVSKEVAMAARDIEIPYIPGALTPTEIQYASELGAELIKIFPIRQLGASYIKDVLASLNKIQLLAVGGVGLENVKALFQAGVKAVGVGGSLVEAEWIQNREKEKVLERLKVFKQEVI